MAMTADSAQGHQTTLPWAQVVRGEPDAVNDVTTPLSSPEQQKSDDAPSPPPEAAKGKPKTAAWRRPSLPNGLTESVMGAISWPALSESTKASSKSASSDLFPIALPESSEGSVAPHPPGQGRSNSVQKNTATARPRSMKKGGNVNNFSAGSSSNSSAGVHLQNNSSNPPSPPPPTFPGYHMHTNGPAMVDHSRPRPVGGFVPQQPAVNDQRHSSRRGNYGPRGDGQNNSRREHDRAHYGNARDNNMQRGSSRGYVRPPPPPPPPSAPTYVHPQPMGPFNPMAYRELVYVPALPMEPHRGVPFIASAMPPPFIPVLEPLPVLLVRQIDYYFSNNNLAKDEFLKSNMDNQGWVPITLIAGFNRVKRLTNNIQVIMESLMSSTVVEIQDDKIRRRGDWMNWTPSSSRLQSDSIPPSSTVSPGRDPLTTSIQRMSLENAAANQNTVTPERSSLSSDASGSRPTESVSPQEDAEGTA